MPSTPGATLKPVRRLGQIVGVIVVIVVLVGAVGGVVWVVIRGIESNPSLVGSLATAASAVIAVVVGRSFDKRRELRQAHRERIAPLYDELIDIIRNVEERSQEDLAPFFKGLAGQLIMHGPSNVIKAWIVFDRHTWKGDGQDKEGMEQVENLLRAIRKDMGHGDRNLDFGDLQRLWVTDLDNLLGPFKPPQ